MDTGQLIVKKKIPLGEALWLQNKDESQVHFNETNKTKQTNAAMREEVDLLLGLGISADSFQILFSPSASSRLSGIGIPQSNSSFQ